MSCIVSGTWNRMTSKVMGTIFILFIFIGEPGNMYSYREIVGCDRSISDRTSRSLRGLKNISIEN